jgi:ubiquinone/menaquinone biosynthesis C-methylase UbiE
MADRARAHGVTPGLSMDYQKRRAGLQAAFLVPHLRAGMDLLDIGCGPGTITLGLAAEVNPGHAYGVDHDSTHVAEATHLASDQGAANVTFQLADAFSLPFDDGAFDVAFENDMFIHLADRAVEAAREANRVLKPGGLLAAREADADLAVWGHRTDDLQVIDGLMKAWQAARGSDISLGLRLPSILRQAGFTPILKSVSADTKGDEEGVRSHARLTIDLLDGPLGGAALAFGWADRATIGRLKESIRAWSNHPDAFFANVHIEVLGRKAG